MLVDSLVDQHISLGELFLAKFGAVEMLAWKQGAAQTSKPQVFGSQMDPLHAVPKTNTTNEEASTVIPRAQETEVAQG